MNELDAETWTALMDRVVEQADYNPGNVFAPGPGTEGGDPNGIRYSDLGPLAFILNEAVDAAVVRGADREALLDAIAQAAGEGTSRKEVDAVLDDTLKCPSPALIAAFGNVTSIDAGIILDAAQRGGCKDYGPPTFPPGY